MRTHGRDQIICRVPGPARHLCSVLARGLDWVPAMSLCPAVFVHALEPQAPAVAADHSAAAAADQSAASAAAAADQSAASAAAAADQSAASAAVVADQSAASAAAAADRS